MQVVRERSSTHPQMYRALGGTNYFRAPGSAVPFLLAHRALWGHMLLLAQAGFSFENCAALRAHVPTGMVLAMRNNAISSCADMHAKHTMDSLFPACSQVCLVSQVSRHLGCACSLSGSPEGSGFAPCPGTLNPRIHEYRGLVTELA
jgi:hypothetical protein